MVRSHTSLAEICYKIGDFKTSQSHLTKALEIQKSMYRTENACLQTIDCSYYLGALHDIRGEHLNSLDYFTKLLDAFSVDSNHITFISSFQSLGNLCRKCQRLREAFTFLNQALIKATRGRLLNAVSEIILDIAHAWFRRDEFSMALKFLALAKRLAPPKEQLLVANIYRLRGECHLILGNWRDAGKHLYTALSEYQSFYQCRTTSLDLAKTHVSIIAMLLLHQGRALQSLKHFQLGSELMSRMVADHDNAIPEYIEVNREATSLTGALKVVIMCQHQRMSALFRLSSIASKLQPIQEKTTIRLVADTTC